MLTQAAVEEGEDSRTPTESQPTPSPTQPKHDTSQDPRVNLEGTGGSGGDQVKLTYDSPLLGGHTSDRAKGSLNLEELSAFYTNLSNRVLALETVNDAQAKEILTLKARIKKLEKRCKPSFSHHRAWLRSVAKLSKMKKLAVDEGRTSNKTEELNLDADTEVIAKDKGSGEKGESTISTARPTAGVTISNDDPEVARDEEIARQLEAELHEEVERERQRAEQASMDHITNLYDEFQARIDVDHELAVRLTHEEHEKNKPLTRTQLRRLMMTYLKHIGSFTHSQLNKRTFEEIQALYIKEQEKVANFVPVGSDEDERLIQKMNEKASDVHKEKVLEEHDSTEVLKMKARKKVGKQTHADDESSNKGVDSSKKRKAGPRMKRMFKRQKTDADLKKEEHLKTFLKIASDEEEVVDYEVLEKRFSVINWESKFYHFDRHRAECIYYRIFRSDGSSRWIKTFFEMMTSGVHILILEDGTQIHMIAERRYPLTIKTLERMLSLRLIAESASDAAYDLLRFIQKHIGESEGYDRGEKDF
nr:hypothetical protein [Tanacetum cinerariifolium]